MTRRVAEESGGFRPDVQGLRAIAVGLVVLAHLATYQLHSGHHVSGGFVGVDVFFVLSGFLITSLLLRQTERTGRVGLRDFYARRARRILPAATLTILAVLAYAAFQLPSSRMPALRGDAWWSALFLANWHFAHIGTSYFDNTATSPLQHYWSLSVEEQFYLVWPLAMLLLAPRLSRRALSLVVAAVLVASLAWSIVETLHLGVDARQAAYFSTPARVYELAMGALLATARPKTLPAWLRLPLGLAGLTVLAACLVRLDGDSAFPGWEALAPTLATAALLVAGQGSPTPLTRLLSLPPLRYAGDISYSLYLWHFPVILLAGSYLPTGWSQLHNVITEAVIMSLLAVGSYHLVEQPFRHRRVPALSSGRRALLLWPVALGLVLAGAGASSAWGDHRQDVRTQAAARWWSAYDEHHLQHPQHAKSIPGQLAVAVRAAAAGAPVPPDLDRGQTTHGWEVHYHCYASWGDTTSRICVLGDRSSHTTVAAVGDSHMGMWLPALDPIARAQHVRLVAFVKLGCSPYDVVQPSRRMTQPECDAFRAWTLHKLHRIHPATVILAARGELFVHPTATHSTDEVWAAGVRRAVRAISRTTRHVIAIGDVPDRGRQPADCLSARKATLASCQVAPISPEVLSNVVTRRAAKSSGARFVGVLPLVCAGNACPLVVGHTVLYQDDSHLSYEWVRHIRGAFARSLGRLTSGSKLRGTRR